METQKQPIFKEIRSNLVFILFLVPFVQWAAFFIMNGRIRKKRWVIMGIASLLITIIIAFIPTVRENCVRAVKEPRMPQMGDYITEPAPRGSDYPDDAQYREAYEAFRNDPEYQAYDKALEEYFESPEFVSATDKKRSISNIFYILFYGLIFVSWLVFMIIGFFFERKTFLKIKNSKDEAYRRLADGTNQPCQNVPVLDASPTELKENTPSASTESKPMNRNNSGDSQRRFDL